MLSIPQFLSFRISTKEGVCTSETLTKFASEEAVLDRAKQALENPQIKHSIRDVLRFSDLFYSIKFPIQKKFNAGPHVTNAWLKLYELLTHFRILNQKDNINCFFNAELPGSFAIATNHWIKTNIEKCNYKWVASSYLPENGKEKSNNLEDTFGLYKLNKDNWIMDPSKQHENGDVTCTKSLMKLVENAIVKLKLSETNILHLYTSDAGIDVTGKFNQQESSTMWINFGQALLGLLLLGKGGTFITKQFTFYRKFSVTLLVFLSTLFDEFYVCKPESSKPMNSEVYIVGKGYRGISDDAKKVLINIHELKSEELLYKLIDMNKHGYALESLIHASSEIHLKQQVKCLEGAVTNARNYPDKNAIYKFKGLAIATAKDVQRDWFVRYPVKHLPSAEHLKTLGVPPPLLRRPAPYQYNSGYKKSKTFVH